MIELSNKTLTQLGTEAIIDFYKTIAVDQLKFPGIIALVTGIKSPFLNVVLDTRPIHKNNEALIKHISDFFAKHAVPWAWFIPTTATDNNLTDVGFSHLADAPAMYLDLSQTLPDNNLKDISIREAGHDDNLLEWIQPLHEGFPLENATTLEEDAYRKLNADLLHQGEHKLRHFTAYYQNEIAAAGTLFISEHSVMLHNLATKKRFQRRGIGTALAIHQMAIAKQLGFKHCFLDSSEEAFGLYQKLGFKVYGATKVYSK